METLEKTKITIETIVNATAEKVWNFWTDPRHIVRWNSASDDWHTPKAENDLREGGKFLSRMESKDGTSGFNFTGEYSKVLTFKYIEYYISDGRKVQISFVPEGGKTRISETFEAESVHPLQLQKDGWQAILENFRKYVEANTRTDTLHFDIRINRDADTVSRIMTDSKTYNEWTSVFNPDSRFEGSWDQDSRITFLGTDENGGTAGMISRIKENVPGKFISIEHIGIIKNGIEITCGPEVDDWQGALENYTFTEKNGKTTVAVDVDTNDQFTPYFKETWPKALEKLKSICERQA